MRDSRGRSHTCVCLRDGRAAFLKEVDSCVYESSAAFNSPCVATGKPARMTLPPYIQEQMRNRRLIDSRGNIFVAMYYNRRVIERSEEREKMFKWNLCARMHVLYVYIHNASHIHNAELKLTPFIVFISKCIWCYFA